MNNLPKVGVGVVVFKDGKILLGKRINAHGDGEYEGPGGIWNIWSHLPIVLVENVEKKRV